MPITHTGKTPSRFPVSILRQELVYTAADTVTSIPSSAYTRSSFSNTCRKEKKRRTKKKNAVIEAETILFCFFSGIEIIFECFYTCHWRKQKNAVIEEAETISKTKKNENYFISEYPIRTCHEQHKTKKVQNWTNQTRTNEQPQRQITVKTKSMALNTDLKGKIKNETKNHKQDQFNANTGTLPVVEYITNSRQQKHNFKNTLVRYYSYVCCLHIKSFFLPN